MTGTGHDAAVRRFFTLKGINFYKTSISAGLSFFLLKCGRAIKAKKAGVKTGEIIADAKIKRPELLLCPPDYALYHKCSAAFLAVLKRFVPVVEQNSIDEAFADITGTA